MHTPESIVSELESALLPEESSASVDAVVRDVYDASQPKVRSRILNLLLGRAYAASPPPVRQSLLDLLIHSVGVLGLVTIAGGVFAKIRLRGGWPDVAVSLDDLQDIRTSDVDALVGYVQQVSIGALTDAAHLLATNHALAGSGAVAVLVSILLRRVSDRDGVARVSSI